MLLGFKAVVVIVLWGWLSQAENRLTAISLGLIMGGAIGNAIDRLAHGAVVDFALLHITTESFAFNWYVFNLADVAIVAGVAGLIYEIVLGGRAAKAP
jgi:signal peptidase II